MAEFPALPLFTDAYLADTRHLTTVQHGAYLLMLMTAWRSGGCCLLNDDGYLARITGLDKRTWLANKVALLSFWHLNDEQKWCQGRLKDERNFAEQVRIKNVAAGKASALKRLNRDATSVEPKVNQKPTPLPSPSPQVTATSVAVSATPKDELQVLETKLREAAGWQQEPHPNLCVVGPIAGLIATGASLDLDVLPVVRSRAPSVTSKTGWRYFIAPIQDAVKARVGAKALVSDDAIALESRRRAALEKLQTHNAQVDLERKRAANG